MIPGDIDTVIERYAQDRKTGSKQVAQEHFLSYIYVVFDVNSAESFMKRTRGMLSYYINSMSLFENPFRGPEPCWLVLMAMVFAFSLCMLADDDTSLIGFFIAAGTLVNGVSLWRIVFSKWLDTGVMIAIYREIIDLIDSTLTANSTPVGAGGPSDVD